MQFELLEPTTLDEAVALLNRYGPDALPLAGGTDLLVQIRNRSRLPERVVALQGIPDLRRLVYKPGEGLEIGPLVTHAEIAAHPMVRAKFTALADACGVVGSPQIRQMGTVAGNLANGSPAADSGPALLALGAVVCLVGAAGPRRLPLTEFFRAPGRTALGPGELITAILVREPRPGTRSVYRKLGRRNALEIAICSVALAACPGGADCHLAFGAVAPVPLLSRQASALLTDRLWTREAVQAAAQAGADECSPIDDQRASAAYRREMIGILIERTAAELSGR